MALRDPELIFALMHQETKRKLKQKYGKPFPFKPGMPSSFFLLLTF